MPQFSPDYTLLFLCVYLTFLLLLLSLCPIISVGRVAGSQPASREFDPRIGLFFYITLAILPTMEFLIKLVFRVDLYLFLWLAIKYSRILTFYL